MITKTALIRVDTTTRRELKMIALTHNMTMKDFLRYVANGGFIKPSKKISPVSLKENGKTLA
jgi:hypothetical protein